MRALPRSLAVITLLLAGAQAPLALAQPASGPDKPLPTAGKLPMKGATPAKPPPAPAAAPATPPAAAPAPAAPAAAAPADEGGPTVDAAAAERARKLMTEGARLHDEGKFSEAYVALVAAWAVKQTPSLAKNLADCEVAIGKHKDAAEHLRYIVKNAEAKPDDQKRAQQQLDEVLKKIGTFRVTVSIDNAEVLLDGAAIGKSPLQDAVYVPAGKHTFEARRDRYEPDRREVEIAAGSSQIVRLQPTVSGPVEGAPGGLDKARPWIVRGGLALTVIGVGLGAGMTVLANNQAKSAVALRTMLGDKPVCAGAGTTSLTTSLCADLKSTGSKQSGFANAAVGMFTVGGVAALVTAGVWAGTVLTKDQPALKPLTGLGITPSFFAGAREGGAALSGQW